VNLLRKTLDTNNTRKSEVFHLSRDGAFHSANSISLDSRENDRVFFFLLLKAAAAHNTQSAARIGEHDRERERERIFAGKSE